MSLNKQDYSDFAKAAVADLIEREVPLEDSVTKVAQEHGLTGDQVHRLIEQTNTLAHINLFEKMAGEEGKYVRFKTADPDMVLPRIQKKAALAKTAALDEGFVAEDFLLPLPDEHFESTKLAFEKTASDEDAAEIQAVLAATTPDNSPYGGKRGLEKVARVRAVIDELEMHTLEEHERFKLACDALAIDLRRSTPEDMVEFEKDAYALHGDDVESLLFRLQGLTHGHFHPGLEKTARTRTLVLCSPLHEKLAECVSAREKALEYGEAYRELQKEASAIL